MPCAHQALVLHHAGVEHSLGNVADLPLTLGGAARYSIFNLLAATLTGAALGLPLTSIARTVARFGADPADNPGRLERWGYRGAVVLIDYAHNPDGLERLLRAARSLEPARLVAALGSGGKSRRRGDRRAGEHRRPFHTRPYRDQGT